MKKAERVTEWASDWKQEENSCEINMKKMYHLKTIILIATEERKKKQLTFNFFALIHLLLR